MIPLLLVLLFLPLEVTIAVAVIDVVLTLITWMWIQPFRLFELEFFEDIHNDIYRGGPLFYTRLIMDRYKGWAKRRAQRLAQQGHSFIVEDGAEAFRL